MSIQQPHRSEHLDDFGADAREMPVFEDGHDLHPIVRQAAVATPSNWVDAVVVSASRDGLLQFVGLADGAAARRWHHADLGAVLAPGTPVAFHSVYGVLAIGEELLSVRAA